MRLHMLDSHNICGNPFHMPAAAVCRKLYDRQGMGIGLLRKLFGKADKSRGSRPERHGKAAGGLMRHMLIQLEGCGLVEKSSEEKGGRQLSPAVRPLLKWERTLQMLRTVKTYV
jgi:ribosomal protein S19E (S16A)